METVVAMILSWLEENGAVILGDAILGIALSPSDKPVVTRNEATIQTMKAYSFVVLKYLDSMTPVTTTPPPPSLQNGELLSFIDELAQKMDEIAISGDIPTACDQWVSLLIDKHKDELAPRWIPAITEMLNDESKRWDFLAMLEDQIDSISRNTELGNKWDADKDPESPIRVKNILQNLYESKEFRSSQLEQRGSSIAINSYLPFRILANYRGQALLATAYSTMNISEEGVRMHPLIPIGPAETQIMMRRAQVGVIPPSISQAAKKKKEAEGVQPATVTEQIRESSTRVQSSTHAVPKKKNSTSK